MSNAAFFDGLTRQVENTNSCAELQATVDAAMTSLAAQSDAIASQMAAIAPILGLLTPPVDPPAAVTWIASLITGALEPAYAPYAKYAAQLTELTAAVASLTTAINNRATAIGSCSITIPPL